MTRLVIRDREHLRRLLGALRVVGLQEGVDTLADADYTALNDDDIEAVTAVSLAEAAITLISEAAREFPDLEWKSVRSDFKAFALLRASQRGMGQAQSQLRRCDADAACVQPGVIPVTDSPYRRRTSWYCVEHGPSLPVDAARSTQNSDTPKEAGHGPND